MTVLQSCPVSPDDVQNNVCCNVDNVTGPRMSFIDDQRHENLSIVDDEVRDAEELPLIVELRQRPTLDVGTFRGNR